MSPGLRLHHAALETPAGCRFIHNHGDSMIVFANGKGGVGKSSSALAVAASIARRAHVVVVDLDPEGFATVMGLGQRLSRDPFNSTPVGISHRALAGAGSLRLIPSSTELHLLSEEAIHRRLEYAASVADIVVVDTPPNRRAAAVQAALRGATTVVVPIIPEFQALAGWYRIFEAARSLGLSVPMRALLCRWEPRTTLASEVHRELITRHPGAVLSAVVPRDQRAAEASAKGLPVNLYSPRCRASRAYELAALELSPVTPLPPMLETLP